MILDGIASTSEQQRLDLKHGLSFWNLLRWAKQVKG